MRRRLVIAAVALVVLCTGWLIDNEHGTALDVDNGGFDIKAPVGRGEVDAYFMGPTLKNDSRTSIRIVKVEPVTITDGLQFVEGRVYQRDDFPLGGVPASWSPGDGETYTPTRVASVPLAGFEVPGQHTMTGEVIILRFRVTTGHRPLTSDRLRVTYRNGFRNHSQTVQVSYTALPPVTTTS